MATQAAPTDLHNALNTLLSTWERRWRWREAVLWLPRSVLPGLIVGVVVALISRLRPFMLREQVLALTIASLAAGILAMMVAIWLWPRPLAAAAQRFDLLFGLKERVSTALELDGGRIHTRDELVERQLTDAWDTALAVPYQSLIRFELRWKEWLVLAWLAGLFILLLLLPNPQTDAVQQASAQNAVIQQASDDLKEITETLATDTTLETAAREKLLETLQNSLETLQEENVSPEEVFSTLSSMDSTLKEEANQLDERVQAQQTAMQNALNELSSQPSETSGENQGTNEQQTPAAGLNEAMNEMSQGLNQMTPEELQNAANALDQAAQQLQETDPATAQALREAAEAIRNGDLNAAQQSLQQAAQNLQQSAQQQSSQSQLSQDLQQAAQNAQQNANQIAQLNQQNQQQNQPQTSDQQNQQGQSGQPDMNELSQLEQSQQNPSDQQPGEQGNEGQQPGEQGEQGQQGQQGQQPGQQGQDGQPSGSSGQPTNQSNDGQPSGTRFSTDGQSPNISDAGSGDSTNSNLDTGGFQSQTGPIDQDNNPDGQGTGEFEPIYAPRTINGQSDDENNIILEPDRGDTAVREGEYSENPSGDVSVPYNQVFSDYRDAVNTALDTDYIPLGLRSVVQDYFTSLDPQR